ncbi:MAG: hypothetical protein K6G10_01985 [Butyrivibrio sp.]|nr:hypothetical protein [Butyrivibrio sp.]
MRITNKIMQNNSLYNINNNKISEDQLNTMMSTGKKITRPSDDPVIAIRALRLRSNVTQLSQYYEKNVKDAQSWLQVTADALSTVTSVLTDCVKQATKGSSKDLTIDDLDTIITQMSALSDEYYSTGNVDYAGRYVFTGYRTDTQLTFNKTTTADYTGINDDFNAGNISTSSRITGKWNLDSSTILEEDTPGYYESDIIEKTVGRLRLSYNNMNYVKDQVEQGPVLKYREELTQPATSSVSGGSMKSVSLTFKDEIGKTHYMEIPVNEGTQNFEIVNGNETFRATKNKDGSFTIEGREVREDDSIAEYKIGLTADGIVDPDTFSSTVDSAQAEMELERTVSRITYTNGIGTEPKTIEVPLLPSVDQSYTINLDADGYTATVNSDGTYTIFDGNTIYNTEGTASNVVVQVTGNGSVHSSYLETSLTIDADHIIYNTSSEEEIDAAYNDLVKQTGNVAYAYFNASTGEIIMNKYLENKLSTLPDLINANSIDVVYDKKEWDKGDIRPENLFACSYTDDNKKTILYNRGNAGHNIAYDVGFAQSIVVNTTADAVFTTDVKRNVEDLHNMLNELKQMDVTVKTLQAKYEVAKTDETRAKIQNEVDAAKKAYDYLREEIQKEFEHKITSMQKALDVANIAVTDNGTRSKRLDLVDSRLMNQTTTFKSLQSDNEDIDMAEAATKLTTAQVTYEASLMATGKISQTSLMNYI